MNTTAFKIKNGASDANHAIEMAEHDVNLIETNQNWVKETTTFVFSDESRLVIHNNEIKAYRK